MCGEFNNRPSLSSFYVLLPKNGIRFQEFNANWQHISATLWFIRRRTVVPMKEPSFCIHFQIFDRIKFDDYLMLNSNQLFSIQFLRILIFNYYKSPKCENILYNSYNLLDTVYPPLHNCATKQNDLESKRKSLKQKRNITPDHNINNAIHISLI